MNLVLGYSEHRCLILSLSIAFLSADRNCPSILLYWLIIEKVTFRKRIDKIDKAIKDAFESGMHKFSQSLQKNIEEWEAERRKLILEEQETLKTTKTVLEQSNQLLKFCKDCHRGFLRVIQI